MSAVAESPVRIAAPDLSDEALASVRDALAVHAPEADRTGDFPWAGIGIVHRAGLLGLGIGARYGGPGLTATDAVRVFRALGAGDPAVALITAMTVLQHDLQARAPWWPEEVYRRLVADSAERPQLLNAIRAEPEWGAPARGGLPATTIRRTADGWVLNGRKGFATGSEGLAYHLVWAATEDAEPLVAHAIVPADTAGVRIEKTWDHLGQRATSTHDVVYTDVRLPVEAFDGRPATEQGAFPFVGGLAVPALYVGVADAAAGWFVRFANERVPTSLGRPIATTPNIRAAAGEIAAQLAIADAVLSNAAAAVDRGDPAAGALLAPVKLLGTRAAITAVQTAVAALGNAALTRRHPLERHLRDVLASRVHPPQEDAALAALGVRLLAV
ncbi:acyl-CoA dehydrogenase family protein [uncultured Amnibacterium sp.]|uniref:acyl-CoA dehydrogenase family protein n=1 Tax=uncultured Amnibacterium sp. TaxID=1631851 RepID=UPI0035C99237